MSRVFRVKPAPLSARYFASSVSVASAVITMTGVTGKNWHICQVLYSFSGDPTGGLLNVETPSGTTAFSLGPISGGVNELSFATPLKAGPGDTVVVRLHSTDRTQRLYVAANSEASGGS